MNVSFTKTVLGAISTICLTLNATNNVQNHTVKANLGKDFEKSYKRRREGTKNISNDNLLLISGTSHPSLSKDISNILGVKLADANIKRFADGECTIQINDNVRGRDVFIVQTCSSPVNDSVIELLLTISAVRRSGAKCITAVVPYFGYKHHRRGVPVSTIHNSRFLSSNAKDFAKMMTHMGIDRVISVDLQRAGQGGEACFFNNDVPLETFMAAGTMIDLVATELEKDKDTRIVVVAPNSECIAKARKFQFAFQEKGYQASLSTFFHPGSSDGSSDPSLLESVGVKQHDGFTDANVVIVDDMVDTAGTISFLSNKFKNEGASKVYVCASHGVLSGESMQRIEASPIDKLYVSNSLPFSSWVSSKIVPVDLAPALANLILTEYHRSNQNFFEQDKEEDYLVRNNTDE